MARPSWYERTFGVEYHITEVSSTRSAIYNHNARVVFSRSLVAALCIACGVVIHFIGILGGVKAELENSGFQVGEFIIRGYGFPGIFVAAGMVLGLWGFGSILPFPAEGREAGRGLTPEPPKGPRGPQPDQP